MLCLLLALETSLFEIILLSKMTGTQQSVFCDELFNSDVVFIHFHLTALKGCRGIVFTHGVWMGGQVAGKKFVRAVSQKQ